MEPALIAAPNAVYRLCLSSWSWNKGGKKKEKTNKWEFSSISKQSNQRATFRRSHLGSETPSCPGAPAEPAAKHSSGCSCHWLQAIREDALATNVQSMINLFLFILMLLQLQQMFKCLLAVTYPRMVLNPYQASNDKSHRFPGLCQMEWYFFFPLWKVLHIFWKFSWCDMMCSCPTFVLSHSSHGWIREQGKISSFTRIPTWSLPVKEQQKGDIRAIGPVAGVW